MGLAFSLQTVKTLIMVTQQCVTELAIIGVVCLLSLYGLHQSHINYNKCKGE